MHGAGRRPEIMGWVLNNTQQAHGPEGRTMTRRERLERKVEKRREWAEGRRTRAGAEMAKADSIAERFAYGQPILVGHHSEGKARRDQSRIHSAMDRCVESTKMADHHESKAAGLERQLERTVFSDDDDAIEALEARIAEQEAERDRRKLVNRLYRKGDAAGLAAIGLDLEKLRAGMEGAYSWETAPYPPYSLTNIGARIRADKKRIEEIKRRNARAEKAEAAGGVVVEGTGEYCRVTFAEKPDRATINALKEAGYRWGAGSWAGRRERLPDGIEA